MLKPRDGLYPGDGLYPDDGGIAFAREEMMMQHFNDDEEVIELIAHFLEAVA
jgi:hypothetical protein